MPGKYLRLLCTILRVVKTLWEMAQKKWKATGRISQHVSRCFDWLHVKMKILAKKLPANGKQFPTVSLHLSGIFSLFLVSTSVLLNVIKI
jgi:hypothetical protein